MSTVETVPEDEPLAPEDWADPAERAFAQRQADLAAAHDLALESRVVETDTAGRVHYLVGGDPDGEPVLFLHGINVPGATWIPLLPALAEGYRLYVPDRPGRGLSEPRRYDGETLRSFMGGYPAEFLDRVGVDRPHVVANSLGGLQAFLLALDHDRVDRLCLVGAPGGLTTEFPLLFRLSTMTGFNRLFYWLLRRGEDVESVKERLEQFNVVDNSAVSDAFVELLLAHRDLPGRLDSERSLALSESSWGRIHPVFDLTDELRTYDRPVSFVWGAEDALWGPEVGRPVAERMPDAEFHTLPDHGHVPWLEPDEGVSERVRAFLG